MRIKTWLVAGVLAVTGCKPSSSGSAAPASSLAVRAASAITQGRLLPNKEGVVDLPQNLQPVSSNQKAYVKHEANGTMWVLLLESMDNPNNFKGRLYCSNPPAARPSKVQVIGPKVGGGAGPVEVTVDGDAPEGWYAVHAGG